MYMTIDDRLRKVTPKLPRRDQPEDLIPLIALRSNNQIVISQRKVHLQIFEPS